MAGNDQTEEETCAACGREECGWFREEESDHRCRGFVKFAILAQIEDLGREEGIDLLMKVAMEEQISAEWKNTAYIDGLDLRDIEEDGISAECKHTSWESERSHRLTIDPDGGDCEEIGIHMKCTECGQHGYAQWRLADTDLPYTGKLD
jgi:hypothetical protein